MEITVSQKIESDAFMRGVADIVREVMKPELASMEGRIQSKLSKIESSNERIELHIKALTEKSG